MPANLINYMEDGANYQARAVLMLLQGNGAIEESWDADGKCYRAHIDVARWENCREQGYVVSLRSANYRRRLNIAFFEHRNSDQICAVKWEQTGINSPTIETADFGGVYKDKFDVSASFSYGSVKDASDWIWAQLATFWVESL